MVDLRNNDSPLQAFAVDLLAGAVIFNTMGADNIRPSGTINDPIIYGIVLDEGTATLPATLANTSVRMTLSACMDTLIRAGPIHYSDLMYFRGLDSYLQFSVNENMRDQELQQQVGLDAMEQASYMLPVVTMAVVAGAYLLDRFWTLNASIHLPTLRRFLSACARF
jgi:hypothetical protein